MDLIFAIQGTIVIFCQSNGRRRVPKGVPTMLRKTMIVFAKAAALTSGLTAEAFAHGDAEGMRGPRCGWLRVKFVAPTSQAAALFYGRLFEIAPAVKPLLRGDMTEQGCKLMATLGVVVNSLGNLEAVLPAASAWQRHGGCLLVRRARPACARPLCRRGDR
jgi:hypothetical protein